MGVKTNAMRILDQYAVPYTPHFINTKVALSGKEVADILKLPYEQVFKTLVTVGASGNHYCFVVPVDCELNLNKAACSVQEKSVHMIKSKELLPLTGYIHGGCSPLGMKKALVTVFHFTADSFDSIVFSAGKIGCHVQVRLSQLNSVIDYSLADIADKEGV